MDSTHRPLVALNMVRLGTRKLEFEYDSERQLNVNPAGIPIADVAAMTATHTMTKNVGDPPEPPDVVATVAAHTITRQQSDPPETPDVWEQPGRPSVVADSVGDDLSTGVVSF
jgi:hypothetical protein